jgi:UDP-N-acetylmuramoylalanine--D-glutamate ligase
VLELSSYQIDLTQSLDCDVAVLLNITPDHLDRYESFQAYAASKARLFAMQSPENVAVVMLADGASAAVLMLESSNGLSAPIRLAADGERTFGDQVAWPTLQGPHNAQNARALSTASPGVAR